MRGSRSQRNLLLEAICLVILATSLVLMVALLLVAKEVVVDTRLPRQSHSRSRLDLLHLDESAPEKAILGITAGLAVAAFVGLTIRRCLVRAEDPPWTR